MAAAGALVENIQAGKHRVKLGLSKKGDPRGRHLVLVLSTADDYTAFDLILEEVLNNTEPVREIDRSRQQVVWRFHVRFLERLLLVFPQAELTPNLDKWIVDQQRKQFIDLPVPDVEIEGFYDYKLEEPASLYDFQKIGIDRIEREIAKIEAEIDSLTEEDRQQIMDEAEQLAEMMYGSKLAAFMLNDELGLGKTIQALACAVRNRWFPALFVVPGESGKWSTLRIIERFFDDDFTYGVADGTWEKRDRLICSNPDLTVVNFECIRVQEKFDRSEQRYDITGMQHPSLFFEDSNCEYEREYEFCVVDEHHRVKNPDAQITRGFLQLKAKRWLLMSGTPILSRIEEIWTVLHKIDPVRFPTLYHFTKDLCVKNSAGKTVGYHPAKVVEVREYLRERSLRRRRDHISDQLPEVVYAQREVVLNAEQRRIYNKIVDELVLEFEDGSSKKIRNPFTKLTRLKQACFSPELYGGSKNSTKIDEMKIDVEQLVESNEKAIIFSQWSRATRILEREFARYNPAYVDGSVKGKKRMVQEDMFNYDDDCKLYIGTIGANREAITLHAATYVLFADPPWTPAERHQAAGRSAAGGLRGIHLPAGTKVHVIEYFAVGTVEEWIQDLLRRKQQTFDSFIERDRGVKRVRVTTKDVKSLLRHAA